MIVVVVHPSPPSTGSNLQREIRCACCRRQMDALALCRAIASRLVERPGVWLLIAERLKRRRHDLVDKSRCTHRTHPSPEISNDQHIEIRGGRCQEPNFRGCVAGFRGREVDWFGQDEAQLVEQSAQYVCWVSHAATAAGTSATVGLLGRALQNAADIGPRGEVLVKRLRQHKLLLRSITVRGAWLGRWLGRVPFHSVRSRGCDSPAAALR
jgi:hypothetical protein